MTGVATGTRRVAFLDEDHVLNLVRGLLAGEDVTSFFAPEQPGDLARLTAGLKNVHIGQSVVDSEVLVLRRGRVDRALIESAPALRLVQRLGSRRDGIDLVAARERGIAVSCLPRPSLVRTAEHAMTLLLALAKRLLPADRAVRAGTALTRSPDGVTYNWAGLTGIGGLAGKRLGIVGLGEVGTLVAERARAFGMIVRYTARTRLPADRETELGVEFRPLRTLLAESDAVTLHVPGFADPVLGPVELALMRPGALLVNTSRGRFVDEDALYAALTTGRLGGAGLDVHAVEPRPPTDRFCALDNVVLTPHVGGGSRRDVLAEIGQLLDNIRVALAGGIPEHGLVLT